MIYKTFSADTDEELTNIIKRSIDNGQPSSNADIDAIKSSMEQLRTQYSSLYSSLSQNTKDIQQLLTESHELATH